MAKQKQKDLTKEEFVGFFDADGSISINLQVSKAKNSGFKMSVNLHFEIAQAQSNIDVLKQINKLVGGGGKIKTREPRKNTNEQPSARLSINVNSSSGEEVLNILKLDPPRLKRVARDLQILTSIKDLLPMFN